jgi:hypothetical protein
VRRRLAVHLAVWVLGAAVIRIAAVPAEVCPPVTADDLRTSIDEAVAWVDRNVQPDGRYLYGYDRGTGEVNADYNTARHSGVLMALFQVHAETGSPDALRVADIGVAHAVESLLYHDDWIAWHPGGNIQTGANALLLAGLNIRRDATGDTTHDDLILGLARFLLQQHQPDGKIWASWSPSTEMPNEVLGPFATGEASWALALTDRIFPDEGFAEAAASTLDYLASAERSRIEGRIARLPDHWAAYTVSALPGRLLTEGRVEYARDLAGFFGIRLRFESQRRGDGVNLAVRWFPGPPAGVGTAGEGLGALWRLSFSEPGLADLRPNMEERLICAGGFQAQRQVSATEAERYPDPGMAQGAWFYRGYTQMDDQQHVLSTLLSALQVIESREAR